MATQELIEYTEGRAVSSPQQIGAGEAHTIIPVFKGRAGSVVVKVVHSDDSTQVVARLSSRPSSNKLWQAVGPLEYVVEVRNAGCDVDTGA